MWGGNIGTQVIGPCFFDGKLNVQKCLHFLLGDLLELLENMPLNMRQTGVVAMDGVPPNFQFSFKRFLNMCFPDELIGRGEARSRDFTCLLA